MKEIKLKNKKDRVNYRAKEKDTNNFRNKVKSEAKKKKLLDREISFKCQITRRVKNHTINSIIWRIKNPNSNRWGILLRKIITKINYQVSKVIQVQNVILLIKESIYSQIVGMIKTNKIEDPFSLLTRIQERNNMI